MAIVTSAYVYPSHEKSKKWHEAFCICNFLYRMTLWKFASVILGALNDHGLRGSACPVLKATGFVNGRG